MSKKLYDCLWVGHECLKCEYMHNPVEAEEEPKCPHNFEHKWRIIEVKKE